MLIKDLKEDYPLVYEAAIDNFDEEFARDCDFDIDKELNEDNCPIEDAFDWADSNQDFGFWSEIDNYNFDEAKEICPHLFESKTEFKKGDYIVVTKGNGNNFKTDYCFKQKTNREYVEPELDISGSTTNALSGLSFDNQNIYTWRYATQEEIEEYDRVREPYDVTTLIDNPETLIGRYVKALVDKPNGGNVKKGEYGKIVRVTKDDAYTDFPSQSNYWLPSDIDSNKYELMPEGFNPDKVEEEFKVGDWIYTLPNSSGYGMNTGDEGKVFKIKQIILEELELEPNKNSTTLGTITVRKKDIRKALSSEIPVSNPVEKEVDMKDIQKQCKDKYPIGCRFKSLNGKEFILKQDYCVYDIVGNNIWASNSQGLLYCNGKWAEVIELPKDKKKYKGKVVHVDTQEKWDFVLKQENYKCIHKSTWKFHKQNSCLTLDEEGYSRFDYYKGENYQILSFDEYLSLNLLHEEWESYLSSLYSKPDEKADINYKDYFVEGEWYIVDVGNTDEDYWLIKFRTIEDDQVCDYKSCPIDTIGYDSKYDWEGELCSLSHVKSARKATKGEVEQYFPNEFNIKKKDVDLPWEVFQYPVAKEDSFKVRSKSKSKFDSASNSYSYLPELKKKSKQFKF